MQVLTFIAILLIAAAQYVVAQIGVLFVCMLFTHAFADDSENGSIYKISVSKVIYVEPDSTKTEIKIDGTAHFRKLDDINVIQNLQLHTAYNVIFKTLSISVQSGNSEPIKLEDCKTLSKVQQELAEPFYISYLNGLFEYLQVPKKNTELSVNIKLLLSLILQVNAPKLLGIRSKFTTETTQYTTLGDCDVKYDVQRHINLGGLTYGVNKTYDMSSCSKLNDIGSLDSGSEQCSAQSEKQFVYINKENTTVVIQLQLQTVSDVAIDEHITYKPWKESSKKLNTHISTSVVLDSQIHSDLSVDFTNNNSEIVKSLKYRQVDNSLIVDSKDSSANSLTEVYSALACDAYTENIYLDVVEQAIKC